MTFEDLENCEDFEDLRISRIMSTPPTHVAGRGGIPPPPTGYKHALGIGVTRRPRRGPVLP